MKTTDQNGQVLIFISLAFVLLGLLAGLGVDLGRGYLMKAQLMRVVDAATLAGAKALKGQVDFEDEAVTAACDAAEMNGLSCGQGSEFDMSVSFVDKDVAGGPPMRFIEITANASVPTTLLRLLNLVNVGDFSALNVSAFAQGGPERPVDLMLVLDRSGSMASTDGTGTTKINALKTAVNEFLDNNFSPDDRIGMVSFATRGCGASGSDFTGNNCSPDRTLGTSITNLKSAVDALNAVGGTNTMEALMTAGTEINSAFAAPGRERSRKAVLLVTDGQPTFMRRFSDSACKKNPKDNSNLPSPGSSGSFPAGCVHGVPIAADRMLRMPLNLAPSNTILGSSFYLDVIRCTRSMGGCVGQNGAMAEADKVRNFGFSGGKDVVVFAIAIGQDLGPSTNQPQQSLDENAKCLLARIANDPNTIGICNSVYPTTFDNDSHLDLKEHWPCGSGPCIDSTQEKGKVFTIDVTGDVQAQLKVVFAEVAALLKLRLTI